MGKSIKKCLILVNKIYIFFSNELFQKKYGLDDYQSKLQMKKQKKKIDNEEDIEVGTLPFYINENDKTSSFLFIKSFMNKFKDNAILGENGLISRFLKVFLSNNSYMNTGLFGRKTEFNLKKRMKLFYIYSFPYTYLFYRIFISKFMVKF